MAKPIKQRDKWRVRWVDESGIRRSAVYPDYKTALEEGRRREIECAEIRQGVRQRPPVDRTFAELCDYWLEHRAVRKRSRKDDESIVRAHLRPAFGNALLRTLSLASVDAFVNTKEHLDPKTVSNVLTLLIAMLNYAKDLGWLAAVPRIRKPKVRFNRDDFRYLRSRDEIQRLLDAARSLGEMPHAMYTCAVYSGLRAGELAALTWDTVDFSRRLITVKASFDGPTKSGDTRYVPIVDRLLPVLTAWRDQNPLPVVFPNAAGRPHAPSARVFQETFHRALDLAGFPKLKRRSREQRYVVFHDLRHTFASHWVMGGGDLYKLQRILGHKNVTMTQRYAHLAPDAFAGDLGRFG